MTFSRTKPLGWSTDEILTSAQQNDIDIKTSNAVDKTSAGDTISGSLDLDATGKISSNDAGNKIDFTGDATISTTKLTTNTGGLVTLGLGTAIIGGTNCSVNLGASSSIYMVGNSSVINLQGSSSGIIANAGAKFKTDDYVQFIPSKSFSRMVSCRNGTEFSAPGQWTWTAQEYCVNAAASVVQLVVMFDAPIDGATLSSVDVYFRNIVDFTYTLSTSNMPSINVWRTNLVGSGGKTSLLTAPSAGQLTAPASTAAYNNSNNWQSWNAVTAVNNIIDGSTYAYGCTITSHNNGPGSVNQAFAMVKLNYTSVSEMRF